MKLLIVEDDAELSAALADDLAGADHAVTLARTCRDARRCCARGHYDVVLLDRILPDADGLSLIPWLRKRRPDTGIVVLSVLDELDARVAGLNAGADDYIAKPVAAEELLARIDALLRRRNGMPATTIRVGNLALDRLARLAKGNGKAIGLNQREFELLEYFMTHAGSAVSRKAILREVWGYHFEPGTNVVDVHISRLRSKLQACGCEALLVTVRGVGYRLGPAKG